MRSSPDSPDPTLAGQAADRWPPPLRLIAGLLGETPRAACLLTEDQWDAFAALVIERHRIAPAILAAFEQVDLAVPGRVRDLIAAEAQANGLEALAQKAETARLFGELAGHGCRPVLLKGWPLAEELCGTAAGRHSKDIDLYVGESEIGACRDVLAGLGYVTDPEHRARGPLIDLPALAAECNDIAFLHPKTGRQVEIHWRSSHFRGWADLRQMGGAPRTWPLDATGIGIGVPSEAANLTYLALHGQQHAWARLKWLHDIALIVRRRGPDHLLAGLAAAESVGAGRAVVVAVRMASAVFGDAPPPGWPEPDATARRMMRRFVRGIAEAGAAPGTARARFDFYWVGLVMAEGLRQRLGVLRYAFWRGPRLYWVGLTAAGDGGT